MINSWQLRRRRRCRNPKQRSFFFFLLLLHPRRRNATVVHIVLLRVSTYVKIVAPLACRYLLVICGSAFWTRTVGIRDFSTPKSRFAAELSGSQYDAERGGVGNKSCYLQWAVASSESPSPPQCFASSFRAILIFRGTLIAGGISDSFVFSIVLRSWRYWRFMRFGSHVGAAIVGGGARKCGLPRNGECSGGGRWRKVAANKKRGQWLVHVHSCSLCKLRLMCCTFRVRTYWKCPKRTVIDVIERERVKVWNCPKGSSMLFKQGSTTQLHAREDIDSSCCARWGGLPLCCGTNGAATCRLRVA